MNDNRVYHTEDILDFGKNEGLKLQEILKFQPSYIEWAIMNLPNFKVNIKSFSNITFSTTIDYYRDQWDPIRIEKFKTQPIFDSIKQGIIRDSLSYQRTVQEIKELIEEDFTKVENIEYTFPEWIIEANNSK